MLAKDYLVNPQVNLTVMEYSKRRFIVLGQVQRPGAYDMPDRDSVRLLQAIGMAGGYTRIVKLGFRPGDAAAMSLIELTGTSQSVESTKKKRPRRPKAEE